MQRILLATIAAVLVIVGGALCLATGTESAQAIGSGMLRGGLVLGAFVLALKQVKAFLEYAPPWLLVSFALGLAIIVYRPKLAGIVLPLLAALWLLGPRKRKPVAASHKARRSARPAKRR